MNAVKTQTKLLTWTDYAQSVKAINTMNTQTDKQTMTTQTKAVKTFRAPADYGNRCAFTVTAEVHGEPPYFAVTGDIYNKATRTRTGDGTRACGCLHDEAAKTWPKIKPIIALHLCDAKTGEPMHAEANGYYWLAGAVGGLGEQYHGDKSPDECLQILADHLRISLDEARAIADQVRNEYEIAFTTHETPPTGPTLNRLPPFRDEARKTATIRAKNTFHDFVNAQRDRWQAEADAGFALIRELANKS